MKEAGFILFIEMQEKQNKEDCDGFKQVRQMRFKDS